MCAHFTFLNIGSIVPKKGVGFGPGIPRDSQYPKFHVKYLQDIYILRDWTFCGNRKLSQRGKPLIILLLLS